MTARTARPTNKRRRNPFATPNEATFFLRLPAEMKDQLFASAKANFRTPTMEILQRLQASMAGESIDEHGVIVVTASHKNK